MHPFLARAHRLAGHLPGVTIAPYFDQDALKVADKAIAYPCREPGALAVHCPREMREMLIAADPAVFFVTDHFRNWPAVLVRMEAIDDEALAARLVAAWKERAPKRLLRQQSGPGPAS